MRKIKKYLLAIFATMTTAFCAFGVACKNQEEYCECEYCKYFHQYIYYYLQENGVPVLPPEENTGSPQEENVYAESITITGVEHSRGKTVEERTNSSTGEKWYWFYFEPSADEGGYTKDVDSLANNPNRVKLIYLLTPDDASKDNLKYTFNNDNVVFVPETEEIVFLETLTVDVTIADTKGNINARDTVRIVARK